MDKVISALSLMDKVFPTIGNNNNKKNNNNYHFWKIENLRPGKEAALRVGKKMLYILVSAKMPSSVAFLLFSLSLVISKTFTASPR